MAKASKARTLPQFDTVVMIEVEGKVSAQTEQLAQDQAEALEYFVENALLFNGALVELLQQFQTLESSSEILHEGRVSFEVFFVVGRRTRQRRTWLAIDRVEDVDWKSPRRAAGALALGLGPVELGDVAGDGDGDAAFQSRAA